VDGVLHYSPRSAVTFIECARGAGILNAVIIMAHYCLSAAVATPLRDAGAGDVRVASRPTEAELLALLEGA
jgi:uroporphyrinogen-III synthase